MLGFAPLSCDPLSSVSFKVLPQIVVFISGGAWILARESDTWVLNVCGSNTWVVNQSDNTWVL